MATYQKSSGIFGEWVRGGNVMAGTRCKLVSEVKPEKSQMFEDKYGNPKIQDVGKIRFQNDEKIYNISLNRATTNALVDAFGEDSNNWIGKVLTTHTEKVMVAGKRVTALYLVPEGYEVSEDDNGYIVIVRPGEKEPVIQDDIRPEDIPF